MRAWAIVLPIVLVLAFVCPREATTHGDLSEQIAAVTARIEGEPRRADLFLKRGNSTGRTGTGLSRSPTTTAPLPSTPVWLLSIWPAPPWASTPTRLRRPSPRSSASSRGGPTTPTAARCAPGSLPGLVVRSRRRRTGRGPSPCPPGRAPSTTSSARALAAADRIDETLATLDEGSRRLGSVVTLELAATELEVSRARYDAALTRMDRLAATAPRKEQWLLQRREILERAGRPAEAREAFAAALLAVENPPRGALGAPARSKTSRRARGTRCRDWRRSNEIEIDAPRARPGAPGCGPPVGVARPRRRRHPRPRRRCLEVSRQRLRSGHGLARDRVRRHRLEVRPSAARLRRRRRGDRGRLWSRSQANKTYWYRVRAFNAAGYSGYSNTALAKTLKR